MILLYYFNFSLLWFAPSFAIYQLFGASFSEVELRIFDPEVFLQELLIDGPLPPLLTFF
jgi:hypothetical protein